MRHRDFVVFLAQRDQNHLEAFGLSGDRIPGNQRFRFGNPYGLTNVLKGSFCWSHVLHR